MPTYPLTFRITDYLKRQIAWAAEALAEVESFCAAPDDADSEPEAARQQQRARETQSMAREYRGLLHEWELARDIAPEAREEIARLSREAATLMEQLKRAYARAESEARRRQEHYRTAHNDLRRGRRSVNIYRPGLLVSPGFIDRKA